MPLTSWKGRYLPIGIAEGCWSLLGGRVFMVGPLRWSGAPGTSNTATRGRLLVGLAAAAKRSEEHTSELQSRGHLVCRLLLEKKTKKLKSHVRFVRQAL